MDYGLEYYIDIIDEDCAELIFRIDDFKIDLDIFYSEDDKELKLTTLSESDVTLEENRIMEQLFFKCINRIELLEDKVKRLERRTNK